jgi:hypothetical protein
MSLAQRRLLNKLLLTSPSGRPGRAMQNTYTRARARERNEHPHVPIICALALSKWGIQQGTPRTKIVATTVGHEHIHTPFT